MIQLDEMPHLELNVDVAGQHFGFVDLRIERYPLPKEQKDALLRAAINHGVAARLNNQWIIIGPGETIRTAQESEIKNFPKLPNDWMTYLLNEAWMKLGAMLRETKHETSFPLFKVGQKVLRRNVPKIKWIVVKVVKNHQSGEWIYGVHIDPADEGKLLHTTQILNTTASVPERVLVPDSSSQQFKESNDNLPDPTEDGKEYKKTASVWAMRMTEPFTVETLEGVVQAKQGDYLCKGLKGEMWPIDQEIFLQTYSPTMGQVFRKSEDT